MKFVFPEINYVFDFEEHPLNTLVIENQGLMVRLVSDISQQLAGYDGIGVLSENDKLLSFPKNVELINQFIPFEMNKKTLINKILNVMEEIAQRENTFVKTAEVMAAVEAYMIDLTQEIDCNLCFPKLNVASLIKASGIEIADDYDSIAERIIDYIELERQFDNKKMFVTLNLRSYISNEEMVLFVDTVVKRGYSLLMIENREYARLPYENRLIVDLDMCEIK